MGQPVTPASTLRQRIAQLPDQPGVYLLKDAQGTLLYVGKAVSLRKRVQSYFRGTDSRGERIVRMVAQSAKVGTQKTASVLEAMVLEAALIKKYQPRYNIDLKDDKSFSYFIITKEKFSRVLIARATHLSTMAPHTAYGPYTSKKQMIIALDILRRIFPFHDRPGRTERGCLDAQLGLCPAPYEGAISQKEYGKNIRAIAMILEGRKSQLVKKMGKEMWHCAQKEEFEKAENLRRTIFALQHIRDVALLTGDQQPSIAGKGVRIEGYDISNISGQYAVGSMVVFENDRPQKAQYRKFKIKTVRAINDVAMMREVLRRRFVHVEWPLPDLILLDGGKGHLSMAQHLCGDLHIRINFVALAKGPTRKKSDLYWSKGTSLSVPQKTLIAVRDEAHRFAVTYHRKLRDHLL